MNVLLERTSELLDPAWAALALLPLALVAGCAILVSRSVRLRWGTYVWMTAFGVGAIASGLACLFGAVEAHLPTWILMLAAIGCAGLAVPVRERTWKHPWLRDVVALCLAAPLTFFAMEIMCNEAIDGMWNTCAFMEVAIILIAFAALYFLAQRRGFLAAVLAVLLVVFGVAEYYVSQFKAAAIMPSDFLAARTAMAVAGGYTYKLNDAMLTGFSTLALALFALSLPLPGVVGTASKQDASAGAHARHLPGSESGGSVGGGAGGSGKRRVAVNIVCGVVLCAGLALATVPQDYQSQFGFKLYYWNLRVSYQKYGLLTGFIAAAQDMPVVRPQAYSDSAAEALIADYAAIYDAGAGARASTKKARDQFEALRPNVVAVMCESYSDLSIFEQLHAGYLGSWVGDNPGDSLVRGITSVSVHGGGTCNSEFELMSGFSMGYLGQGKYPYLQYSFDNLETLASTFKEAGYRTSAIHPAYGGNWDRDIVYPAMGFDRSLFYKEFTGAERFHHYVSDGATYDKILDLLATSDEPQFVLDVTLQNHSGYGLESIPASERTHYRPSDYGTSADVDKLNEFLSCIVKSDADIEAFIDELRDFDEPVVLLFFGDHQPALSRAYNDAFFTGEDDLDHAARIMETPYVVWANYDVAGREQDGSVVSDLSVNYLGAFLLEQIGAPLTDFQKAQLAIRETMPIVSTGGYTDQSGQWHELDWETSGNGPNSDLSIIQYYRFMHEL